MAFNKINKGDNMNTKQGGSKVRETIIERYGPDYYKNMGRRGGLKKGVKKGFACMTPEQRIEAGRKGGRISRRTVDNK